MFEVFEELNKFSDIMYYDDPHEYYRGGKKLISVTTLIGKYEKPFDVEYFSAKKAMELGVLQSEIKRRWKEKNLISQLKGTAVHAYIENCLANKVFPYPAEMIKSKFSMADPIKEKYDKIIILVNKFKSDIYNKLIPIRSEFVIGDNEYGLCGMIDQIFFNKKSGMLELWDWKTNEEITISTRYPLLDPISNLSNSKLDVYSLQLSLYKLIIEKNTSLKFGNCYLNWFNEKNSEYKIFKCHDYREYAKLIIDHFNSENKNVGTL